MNLSRLPALLLIFVFRFFVFSFFVFSFCFQSVSIAWQHDSPGATIKATRPPDLEGERDMQPQFRTLDPDSIKEHDRLVGTCRGPEEDLLDGVNVRLFSVVRGDDSPDTVMELGSVETDSDGAFLFEDLQSQFRTEKFTKYFVAVMTKEGYATKFRFSWEWETDPMVARLARRAMVRGVIRNQDGEFVSGARVSFHNPLKDAMLEVFDGLTDDEGRFEINDFGEFNSVAHQVDGEIRGSRQIPIHIEHPDYGKISLMIERTPNLFEITITSGARYSGRIVNEANEPVSGCRIRMQSHNRESAQIWLETTSDDQGNFECIKIPGVRANLFFATDELIGYSVEVSGTPGSVNDLGDIKILRPEIIKGVLIDDETGEPLNAQVADGEFAYTIGWHGPEQPATSAGISQTDVNNDGTFECRFLPGKNTPYVSSAALKTISNPFPHGIDIEPGSDLTLEFRVRKTAKDK